MQEKLWQISLHLGTAVTTDNQLCINFGQVQTITMSILMADTLILFKYPLFDGAKC